MKTRAWTAVWLGLATLFACGNSAVDFPTSTVDAGTTTAGCTKDTDCPVGICSAGKCAACSAPTDCIDPAKPVCDSISGSCVGCTTSTQCSGGLACISGQCSSCTSTAQCAAGAACINGVCGRCATDAQCGGTSCVAGVCGGASNDAGTTGDASGACSVGFVGAIGPVESKWDKGFGANAGGKTGKAAGDNACNISFPGTHACTWEELKASDTCNKLTQQKATAGMTAWMHRTGPETAMADDNPNLVAGPPARGGRCNDWTYETNHAFDGEWIEFGNGAMKGHFDSDTADDNGNTSAHAAAGVLECNGESRNVMCCN